MVRNCSMTQDVSLIRSSCQRPSKAKNRGSHNSVPRCVDEAFLPDHHFRIMETLSRRQIVRGINHHSWTCDAYNKGA